MLHGQTRYNIASRFFREIPGELMQRVRAMAPRPSWSGVRASLARWMRESEPRVTKIAALAE